MASIGGVSGNNTTSSLYNSSHIISGLASGLDTEGMIEGLVQSYQTKIQNLSNKITKTEWKQEAYRSIINKLNSFASKYTSYTSSTNLMSESFFSNAVNLQSMGVNKDKVSATGRTDSDVKITAIEQLATAARYSTAGQLKTNSTDFSIAADSPVKFSDKFTTSALSGSLTLTYGGQTVSLAFDKYEDMIPDTKTVANDDGTTQEVKLTAEEKAGELKKMIEKKLGGTQISLSNGQTKNAADMINVELKDGKLTFSDKTTAKNAMYISGASGGLDKVLGLDLSKASETKPTTIDTSKIESYVTESTVGEHISGKGMNISLDGKTKTIALPTIKNGYFVDAEGKTLKDDDGKSLKANGDNYAMLVQKSLDEKFGSGKFKVTNEAEGDALQLKIKAPDNSDMAINTDAGKALGIDNYATNYLNTSKTLGELMDESAWEGLTPSKAVGKVTEKDGKRVDQKGNLVDENNNRIDQDGNPLYDFKVNGVTIGSYGKGTKLSAIINDLNANSEAGVRASYSQTTRQFTFTSKDTGVENGIEFDGLAKAIFQQPVDTANTKISDILKGEYEPENENDVYEMKFKVGDRDVTLMGFQDMRDFTIDEIVSQINGELAGKSDVKVSYDQKTNSLTAVDKDGKQVDVSAGDKMSKKLFEITSSVGGSSYTKGQDAKFTAEINGQTLEMTRGSNSANIDGMTVTLKDTFNTKADEAAGKEKTEAVTFQRSTDSDKIVDAVRGMVNDYNEMMSEIRNQYATLPYRKSSNGAFSSYEPLTDEDRATMSESAIKAYEEKAKQGLLFNDSNLSGLYEKMRGIFTAGGADQAALQQMGISISYSSVDGSAQLSLNENKLREALDSDPDAVAKVFTRSGGDGTNPGIMQSMKTQLDRYAGLTGATKGILVQQAGTPLNSLSLLNNNWQKQIDSVNTEIERWQDKLSTQVDKYTSMFSKLEVLINQMNSQSSTLAGLMGG